LWFSNCKKNVEPPVDKSNIVLYNKPLSVIQECIKGKWKLEYEKGGICSICINNSFRNVSYIWQFNKNNKIKRIYNDSVFTDSRIKWIRDLGTYTNGDYTYIMHFSDKRAYPYDYIVDRIYNDTLILYDAYTVDAVSYHFIKSN
jgi:hypothetical protein